LLIFEIQISFSFLPVFCSFSISNLFSLLKISPKLLILFCFVKFDLLSSSCQHDLEQTDLCFWNYGLHRYQKLQNNIIKTPCSNWKNLETKTEIDQKHF
jgi:hypothetical protein